MTKRLAVIDLGVIVDSSARANLATQARVAYLKRWWGNHAEESAMSEYRRVAFDPANVRLDTLIEGVNEALHVLQDEHGYDIIFLSSRPLSMRTETLAWLSTNLVGHQYKLDILLIETPKWMALEVRDLVVQYSVTDLLVVDDEMDNLQAVADVRDWHKQGECSLKVAVSLAEAVKCVE